MKINDPDYDEDGEMFGRQKQPVGLLDELDYQKRMALAYQAEAKDLRAALAERDAKIRELDAWLRATAILSSVSLEADTKLRAADRLRELGLITEELK